MPNLRYCVNDYSKSDDALFSRIAKDIETQGYSINPGALSDRLSQTLSHHQLQMMNTDFKPARIGRAKNYSLNQHVRGDQICWLSRQSVAERLWLKWSEDLQVYLNRHLFLGLFSFESHFAHYAPGAFYRRHLDAFQGEANRILSVVVYLNRNWEPQHGGDLVLYLDHADTEGIRILPSWGTVVVFLSEQFPHEVLPAKRERYSIAGWYRLNASNTKRADPPQ